MKGFSRLALYIIINILISALTTLTVLWLWDRAHPTPESAQPGSATPASNIHITENPATSSTSETGPNLLSEDIHIIIRTVVGAGNLEAEYVEIANQSDGAVDLTGYQLMDEGGQTFTFPSLILNKNGAVEVHSKAGEPTVIQLYWQAKQPVWENGEIVKLLNTEGDIMAMYSIP
jgi:hypothetical protein